MRRSRARTSKSKSREPSVSQEVVNFVNKKFNNKVPVTFLTGLTKTFCKKPIDANHPFVKRNSDGKFVDGQKLTQYLGEKTHHEKGKPLSEEAIKRVFKNCCNPEGKLSFEYIMKAADAVGMVFPQNLAKAAVRKYGRRKDHLNVEDCLRIAQRR
jgi:hypothetical protein